QAAPDVPDPALELSDDELPPVEVPEVDPLAVSASSSVSSRLPNLDFALSMAPRALPVRRSCISGSLCLVASLTKCSASDPFSCTRGSFQALVARALISSYRSLPALVPKM